MITRPPNFKYKPGDYVYINIPRIANNEWHPFTISSSPEQNGVLWVHVRGVGTWTKKLYQHFDEAVMKERRLTNRVAIRREKTFRAKERERLVFYLFLVLKQYYLIINISTRYP